MSIKSRAIDVVVVVALIAVISGVAHFVITNPLGPSRLLYILQSPFIERTTRCTENAPEWMSDLQSYATRNIGAPASQLAYITSQGNLHHCETGWKDGIFGDLPVEPSSRFRFASSTKTVTAIAILDLVNQNKLSLDTSIVDLLALPGPFKDPRIKDITIRHLLSHKAGWDRKLAQDVMFMRNVKPWCPYKPEQLMQTSLMYEPGQTTAYSNLGYCLLGLAIEAVENMPYRDFMAQRYEFDQSTLEFVTGPYQADEVGYDFRFEEFYTRDYYQHFDFEAVASSAGLSGSASDLAAIVKTSLSGSGTTVLDGPVEPGCDVAIIQNCYGYGVYRYQPDAAIEPVFIHDGKFPGAVSAIFITPSHDVLVWLGAGGRKHGDNVLPDFYQQARDSLLSVRSR